MQETLLEWGYGILALYSFGGGMLALATAGIFSSTGELDIYLCISIAFVANFLGDQFLFYMARNNQGYAQEIIDKYQNQINLANSIMDKYGNLAIFLQKYIYGIKTLIPLCIGLTNFDAKKFLILNFVASLVWAIVVGISAYMLGDIVLDFFEEYKYKALLLFILIFALITYSVRKIK